MLWTLRDIGSGAMRPPRYWQQRYEPSAILATVLWTLFDDASSDVVNNANTMAFLQREWGNSVQPYKKPTQVTPISAVRLKIHVVSKFVLSAITNMQLCVVNERSLTNLIPALQIRFWIANSCTTWRGIFKGLSQDGGWEYFSNNLRVCLFNKGLSNEPHFGQIHFAGQYI